MSGFSTDNLLAAVAVWVAIMLPSAAFGEAPAAPGVEAQRCQAPEVQALFFGFDLHEGLVTADRAA